MPRTKSRARSGPPRLDLTKRTTVKLDTLSGPVTVEPFVEQTVKTRWPGIGQGDVYGIRHTFDLIVERCDDDPPDAGAQFRAQFAAYALDHAPAILTDDRLLIGRAEVDELPMHVVRQCGGFFDSPGACGDEGPALCDLLEDLTDEASGNHVELALIDGSFIWPRTLAVHPRLRGRRLGIRLLAHALFAMHRSSSDIAAFDVGTVVSCFDREKREITKTGTKRFKRYYAQLGFRSWPGDEGLVYLPLGLYGLPVDGLR